MLIRDEKFLQKTNDFVMVEIEVNKLINFSY